MTVSKDGDEQDPFNRYSARWPRLGDRLLVPAHGIYLAETGDERSYRLLLGYKRAGDILVEQALADRADLLNLVLPALFNYRHYVELALKAIIDEYGHVAAVQIEKRNHKLPELWAVFLKISTAFGQDISDDAVVAVGNCILEIEQVDSGGTAFRYAQNLKGKVPELPKNGLDLIGLRDVMNGIGNFFEAAEASFDSFVQSASESYEQDF